ncbi:MAG: hypothetical protein AVO35_07730 [Candidatus Aegiribacteria sp. MLS_C]|nr:MAG: hypothetical protein AVO35_07730 [Candidatus Aegiribacteria sp. MLS_C]
MNRPMMLFAAVLLSASSLPATPEGVPLQYMDPRGRTPMTTRARLETTGERGPYERTVVREAAGPESDRVVLLVEEGVSGDIADALATYQADLENEGWAVELWLIDGGTATDIRNDLVAEYAQGLSGAVCIGDIPTGWMDCGYGEYPVDVYLMDMNGTWTDSDSDGLFESYSGGAPEIWVGRLTPTYMTIDGPANLLNGYFARNHAYRTGGLVLPDRALAYEEAFTGLTGYLDLLYTTVVTKSDPVGTCADDFKAELLNGYEWVHLISHSSPWGSSFHTGAPPAGAGTLNNLEVPPLDPHASFYVLNCCSNGRWTEVDNLANSYIWCDSYGLAVLAQAKVDYTNDFQEYYQSLAGGNCLGEAFRVWLGNNMYMEDGAVLLGDPTLRPRLGGLRHSGLGGGAPSGTGADSWLSFDITDGLHTQGRVDTYYDPGSGMIFAVCGTSDPVRANVMSTCFDGDSWAAPVQVSDHEYWDWHPTVGGDGQGNVWCAWQSMDNNHEGYDIYISRWSGGAWVDETILTDGDPYEVEPSLDGGGGRAWLVWQKWQNGSTDIEGVFWTGSSWSSIQDVSCEDGAERYPDVARGDDGFGLAYHARRDGAWVVCFRDAPDSGPFGAETAVSSPSSGGRYADLTYCDGQYWLAWQDDSGCILVSHGSGSSWTPPEQVSSDAGCTRPSISSPGTGEVTVTWTWDSSQLHTNTFSGGAWQGYYAALSEDALDDASLAFMDGTPWAVYGRRDVDLQWDLWACTPDPLGTGGSVSESMQDVSLSLAGRNPFSASVTLMVGAESEVSLRIYDMSGRVLLDRSVLPGPFTWDGREDGGPLAPAGVYFAVAADGETTDTCRLVRL